jgi:hypothetical protein
MNIKNIVIVALAMLAPVTIQAQKKKPVKKVTKPVVVAPAEPQEDPRIKEMRELTQQIIFIDSTVISKTDFLNAICLNPESGLLSSYDDFVGSDDHSDCTVYLNEMGNKCYFSNINEQGRIWLYTADKLGEEWGAPIPVTGIDEGISEANYPFMMADGITLYFSAKGSESIGGYDIFFTRNDSENGHFFKPENLGMPFNSEANDYMYAIDEMANIGYFVSDRRQPAGKVCVYTFIPPTTRRTYNTDNYSTEQLRSRAEIRRIADTWGNGKDRKVALARLEQLRVQNQPGKSSKADPSAISFVINDRTTYTSISQFKADDNDILFREYQNMQKQIDELKQSLDKARSYYIKAKPQDRSILKKEILDSERQYEHKVKEAKSLEKRIRNAENAFLQNK